MSAEQEKSARKRQYSAPALEKGLDILELLSRESEGLSLSDIAQRLNRSVGELFRMLAVLEQRGYVQVPAGSDTYLLSLKLFQLANRFPPVKRLTLVAASLMKKLAFDIEQSCHLVIYYEGCGHVVAQQDPPSERILSVRLGAKAPLADSCSGHLLLAYADDAERSAMLEKIPKVHRKPKEAELQTLVERVTEQGYESIQSSQVQGVRDIGFPVFDHENKIVAALVVPFFSFLDGSHPVDFARAKSLAMETAGLVSAGLGHALDEF